MAEAPAGCWEPLGGEGRGQKHLVSRSLPSHFAEVLGVSLRETSRLNPPILEDKETVEIGVSSGKPHLFA